MQANLTEAAHGAVQTSGANAGVTEAAKAGVTAKAAGSTAARIGSGGTGTSSGVSASGSASTTATGQASVAGALKGLKGWTAAHFGAVAKTGTTAIKASFGVKALVAVGVGLAGLVVAAHAGDVSGVQATISSVPSWTSGPTILGHMQAVLGGGASAGVNGSGNLGLHGPPIL